MSIYTLYTYTVDSAYRDQILGSLYEDRYTNGINEARLSILNIIRFRFTMTSHKMWPL